MKHNTVFFLQTQVAWLGTGFKTWAFHEYFPIYFVVNIVKIKLLSPVPSLFWLLKSWLCSYSLTLNFLAFRLIQSPIIECLFFCLQNITFLYLTPIGMYCNVIRFSLYASVFIQLVMHWPVYNLCINYYISNYRRSKH